MKCSLGISNFLREISAAAKSLQLYPTLYDPIDGSPPGSPVPGILQARILEWVAISFSSLSHSIVFLYFFALITEGGFLISPCYSLEFCIQMGISFLFFSLLFSQLFVRPPQTALLLFCISFSWAWSGSLSPVQYHEPLFIVHQALCLSDLAPLIYFSLPLHSPKGFDLGHT